MKGLANQLVLANLLSTACSAPSATIDSGVIVGVAASLPSFENEVNQFLGIPFAQPPVGNGRFAPPQKVKPWSMPKNTTAYGPSCVQQFNCMHVSPIAISQLITPDPTALRDFAIEAFDTPGPPAGESEDCLYINVFVPAGVGHNMTVMFWIYGGNLLFGSNSMIYFDGTSFAANQDVIVVAPNYRTNAFGFPMSPQLPLAERNLGFLDQRLALDWVQRNIHAFGGSPNKVTIFGESAGAASVDELITTMPRNPSFRAAILQSGQTSLYINRNNSDTTPWTTLMSALNCTGSDSEILQCARVADATSIKSIGEHAALAFRPVSDNITQLEFPAEARAAGHIARVPILTGTNAQEGRLFTINQTNVTTFLETTFPSLPAAFYSTVVAAYPEGTPGLENGYDVNAQIFTDFFFQCPAAIVANSSCTLAKLPTWRYLFNATFPNTQLLPGIGVYHSSEIPIVFGTYPQGNANQEEVKLSQYMQTAWANFAKDPSGGPGWANWPEVGVLEAAGGEAVETSVEAGALDQRCALYAAIYAEIGI